MGSNKSTLIGTTTPQPSPIGPLATTFRSLQYRDFAVFIAGNFLSNIGTWMQNIALGWVILVMTNSPFLLGLNGFLSMIPSFLFSIPGGAIADRLNRRKLMLSTQSSMMILALILALLTTFHHLTITEILLISTLTGAASALNYPAYQALVPDLVGRDELLNAIALNSAQFNMSRAIGPTLAGIALGALGAASCFYLNSLSYLALIIALFVIVIPPRHIPDASTLWGTLLEGFQFVNKHRLLIIMFTVPAFLSFLGLPFIVLMPVFARDLIKVGASGLGYLMAGAGIGAVLAALALASLGVPNRRAKYILLSSSAFSVALIFLAHAHSFWWAFFLLAILGATMVGAFTLSNTLFQTASPPQLRGRIMSMFLLSASGLLPFGNLQAGAVAEALGTRMALTIGGSVCLVYFITLLILLPRLERSAPLPQSGQEPGDKETDISD